MGRRKARSKPLVTKRKLENKQRNILPKKFDCIFCTQELSIECTIKKKEKLGSLKCVACDATFQTKIHSLCEEIDVYTMWKDKVESQLSDEDGEEGNSSDEDPQD